MKQSHILAVAGIVMLILFYITSTSREGFKDDPELIKEINKLEHQVLKVNNLPMLSSNEKSNMLRLSGVTGELDRLRKKLYDDRASGAAAEAAAEAKAYSKPTATTPAATTSSNTSSTSPVAATTPVATTSTPPVTATTPLATTSAPLAVATSPAAPSAAVTAQTQTRFGMSPTLEGAAKSVGDTATSTYNSFGSVISSAIAKFGLVLVVGASIVIGVIVVWALWNTFIGRPATAAPPGLAPMIGAPPARWF
jgi:CCR4-NOT transcriptional regulation complex NOT5 subunit